MRVAALYDVHGNLPALEAVLADDRCRVADVVVCGGDLVAGSFPSECFDLLRGLGARVRYVRGNGDRNVVERRPEYVTLLTSDDEAEEAIAVAPSRLVVCGHTHVQVDRRLPSGRRVVDAGSVGRPYERAPAAYWALVDDAGVDLVRTEYDVEAAVESLGASSHPDAEEAAAHLLQSWDPHDVSATFVGLRGA